MVWRHLGHGSAEWIKSLPGSVFTSTGSIWRYSDSLDVGTGGEEARVTITNSWGMLFNLGESSSVIGWWAAPTQPRILRLLVLAGPLCGKAYMGSRHSQGGIVNSVLANRELGHQHGQCHPAAMSAVPLP